MRRIIAEGGVSLYETGGHGAARLLVCSTPASRQLLTDPLVTGHPYRTLLKTATSEALSALTGSTASPRPSDVEQGVAVLNVLRGALSFGAEEAVARAFGVDPQVSFVGTERPGDAPITLTYARWELGSAAVLVVADIIGTGHTLSAAVAEALRLSESDADGGDTSLRSIVIVTVASRKGAERVAASLAGVLPHRNVAMTIVALEAFFDLPAAGSAGSADSARPFRQYPFDLLRSPGSTTPEFESARLRSVGSLFERCAVYDGGVRAFTPLHHAEERKAWWAGLVDENVSLRTLAEVTAGLSWYRLPYAQWSRTVPWAGLVDDGTGREIHELGRDALRLSEDLSLPDYAETYLARS